MSDDRIVRIASALPLWLLVLGGLFGLSAMPALADDPIQPIQQPATPMQESPTPSEIVSEDGLRTLDQELSDPEAGFNSQSGLELDDAILELVAESPMVMDLDTNQPSRYLSLTESISLALEQNLGLNVARYNPGIAQDDVLVAEAIFDPSINAGISARERGDPPASALDGVTSGRSVNANQRASVGVTKRFSPGTEVGVDTGINRRTTNSAFALLNPDYASDVGLTVRQPLLRGFGETVNLAPIARARAGVRASRFAVRREVLDLIANAEIAYWNLAAARQRQALFLSNLRLAKNLLQENLERQRLGLANRLDVLQAEASLAARSEAVIVAQEDAYNAEDNLRAVMGMLYQDFAQPITIDPLPEDTPALPDFRMSISGALASDMDSQIQAERIEQFEIDRQVALNRTLPDLDFVAGAGVLGRDDDAYSAYEGAFNSRGYEWSAGLELSFPWGMQAEKARLRSSVRNIYRAEAQLAEIQQELLLRLRTAWRAVASGRERVATTSASLRLNAESFDQERARYASGLINFRNVLEAQRDFDDAKLRHLRAVYDLQRADVALARLDGRLLRRHGFTWDELDSQTQQAPDPVDPIRVNELATPDFAKFNRSADTLPENYGQEPNALKATYLGEESE